VSEFEPALELFSDVLRNARFPAEEVRRELPRRQNAILAERDNPSVVLTNAVLDALYGSKHAYGVSLLGTQTSMKQVRPDELRAFHRTQVRPDRVTVAASGDISKAALLEALEKVFGSWQGRGVTSKPLPDPPAAAGGARILLVDRPGATQSHVAVADIGVARKTPDYEPLVVLNTILGGQFSSRLNLNLREAHAYTYGAGSVFDMRRFAGPFRTFGAIVKESTGPAIGEIFREIARLRSEPVTPQELSAAQTYLVRRLPARFETTSSTADALSTLAIYELPLDEYATYPARIARVTAADVQRVANAYLHPERMRIVVLGDAAALRPGLEALGLGAVEPRAMP
jgi:predicted Zn-dependent peptidase